MPSTLTTFDFAIKERYAGQYPESLMFTDRPLLGSLAKDEDFAGDPMPIPLIQGAPQGIAGASLATAQTASSNVVGRKFNLVVGDYFGTVDIGDKVMTLSRKNPARSSKTRPSRPILSTSRWRTTSRCTGSATAAGGLASSRRRRRRR